MMALRIVIDALLVIGAFFALAGTLGVLKMPDTFCRMQASTCITTLGMLGVAIGGLLYAIFIMGHPATAIKIAVIGGPCSIESEEQAVRIAREVKDAGGCMLRGGAYKPRGRSRYRKGRVQSGYPSRKAHGN